MPWLLKICLVLPLFRVSHGVSASHLEVLQLAHSRASTDSRASSRALEGFQKYTDEVVDEYLRTGKDADETCHNVSILIKDYINQSYWANLDAHNADLLLLDCSSKVLQCTTTWFSETNLEHIANLSQIINHTRGIHFECRKKQAACCETGECQIYNSYRRFGVKDERGWGTVPLFPDCYEPDLNPDYIRATEVAKRQTMEGCLKEVYDWHHPIYQLYLACKKEFLCCEGKEDKCDDKQLDFEFAHCVGHDYINDHCKGHRDCWDRETAACTEEAVCPPIQSRVEIRRAENETAMRIVCLLDVILLENDSAKAGMLSDCKNATHSDQFMNKLDFWNIPCPPEGREDWHPSWPTDKLQDYCATPDDKQWDTPVPCDVHFRLKEYGVHMYPADNGHFNPWRNTGSWIGLETPFVCLHECPGHYTDEQTQRNTSFWISTDPDSYKNKRHPNTSSADPI